MVALASAFVRLRPQPDRSEFKREGEKMGADAGAAAGKSFGDGFYKDASGKLRQANGRFATDAQKAMLGAGEGAGKKFGRAFAKQFEKSGDSGGAFGKALALTAARLTLVGGAAAAAAPGLLHLTAAVIPATGAMLALPAAMAAVRLASATVKIAVGETGGAISAGLTGTAKQAEKALKELTPAQRAFAKEIIALKPQIEGLKASVSERFFRPFADDVKPLAERYFPLITKQMSDLAGPLGGLAEEFSQVALRAGTIKGVNSLFDGTSIAVIYLRQAIGPLAQAFSALISSTAKTLPGITQGFVALATRFGAFVQRAADSGAIFRAFQSGAATLKDLGGIVYNVGSIIGTVFGAAQQGSQGLLSSFRELTGQAAAFLRSAQGFGALSSVFGTLGTFGAALRTSLGAVLPAIASSIQALAPAITGLAGPFSQLVVAVAPLLPILAGITAQVITALTPAIAGLARYFSENATAVKVAAVAFGVWIAALKISSALIAVQAAGGLLAYLKTIKLVTAATKIWAGVQIAFNAIMALNPFVLAIAAIAALVAIIVVAYKRSETFRNVVQTVWAAIKTAISATVSWFTGTAWPALKGAYDAAAKAVQSFYNGVIKPAWGAIKVVIDVVVKAISSYINFYLTVLRGAATVVMWFYRNVISPVFAAIRKVVEIWWLAMRVAFAAFIKILQAAVMPVLRSAGSLFATIFRAIRAAVSAWWSDMKRLFGLFRQYVVGPLMTAIRVLRDAFKAIFSAISTTVRNWWTGTVQPIFANVRRGWQALASYFSSIYTGRIKPVFSAFIGFMKNNVAGAFKTAVGIIRTAWAAVKEAARKPVQFVVNSVINPFIRGLNKAASVVGVKDRISEISGFANGGQVPGSRPPGGADNHFARVKQTGKLFAIGSKEFITNSKSTEANLPLVKAINAKRGKVTRDDVDPFLDGGGGDGIGDVFKKIMAPFKGAASVITDPGKAIKNVASKLLAQIPGSGQLVSMVRAASSRIISGAAKWLTNLGLGGGIGGGGVAGGYRGMQRLISARFPGLGMISGFRKGATTLSGNRSYHSLGRAVDYPPVRALAAWIRSTFGAKTKELITPFQDLNLHNGRPHRYTGAVWNQHNFAGGNAHVHWAARHGGMVDKNRTGMPMKLFDQGGFWPSGTVGVNLSGRTEYVDPNKGGRAGADSPARWHPADLEALGRIIGQEINAAVGAGNYAAGRRTSLYARGG